MKWIKGEIISNLWFPLIESIFLQQSWRIFGDPPVPAIKTGINLSILVEVNGVACNFPHTGRYAWTFSVSFCYRYQLHRAPRWFQRGCIAIGMRSFLASGGRNSLRKRIYPRDTAYILGGGGIALWNRRGVGEVDRGGTSCAKPTQQVRGRKDCQRAGSPQRELLSSISALGANKNHTHTHT